MDRNVCLSGTGSIPVNNTRFESLCFIESLTTEKGRQRHATSQFLNQDFCAYVGTKYPSNDFIKERLLDFN